jgi:ribosome-associated protein
MEKRKFKLKENSPFIELVKLMKIEGVAETGGHGKSQIEDGEVKVNGEEEFRVRRKLYAGDVILFAELEVEIVS